MNNRGCGQVMREDMMRKAQELSDGFNAAIELEKLAKENRRLSEEIEVADARIRQLKKEVNNLKAIMVGEGGTDKIDPDLRYIVD